MSTLENSAEIKEAVHAIRQGQVIAYPTETVYSLGCDPFSEEAVTQLLQLKQRSADQGLIIIAAHWEQLETWVQPIKPCLMAYILSTWPGPTTWVFPSSPIVPIWIRGKHTSVALRVSPHPTVQALCNAFGRPIVSTSANRSGALPMTHYTAVCLQFGQQIKTIIASHSTDTSSGQPSVIKDAITGAVIRP